MISVLVAFRETGDGHRTRLWEFVRRHLEQEFPEAEIVEASDDGRDPFNKSMAVNTAAARATGDVFYILDSDCYIPADQVRAAAALLDQVGWSRPWKRKLRMYQHTTERVLEQGLGAWDPRKEKAEHVNAFPFSPPLLLRRETYADVGGMDERYRGWGGEDTAFARVLWKMGYGLSVSPPGDCWHLWHPRLGVHGRDLWVGQDSLFPNSELDKQYNRARTPEQMRELIAQRQGSRHEG